MIEAELREILREHVRYPDRPIDPGDHLIFDLEILDDDATFGMIPEIHRRFGIDPPGSAWSSAATFADVGALVERYQRQPATAQERARDEAERRAAIAATWLYASRVLAALGMAVGLELAGREGAALLVMALGLFLLWNLPAMLRDSRRVRRERAAWKARRATRT